MFIFNLQVSFKFLEEKAVMVVKKFLDACEASENSFFPMKNVTK